MQTLQFRWMTRMLTLDERDNGQHPQRPQRIWCPTDKLLNEENDHMTALQRAVGYLTTWLVPVPAVKKAYAQICDKIRIEIKEHQTRLQMYDETVELNVDGSLNYIHPMLLTAKTGANDTFHYHQAMQQDWHSHMLTLKQQFTWRCHWVARCQRETTYVYS